MQIFRSRVSGSSVNPDAARVENIGKRHVGWACRFFVFAIQLSCQRQGYRRIRAFIDYKVGSIIYILISSINEADIEQIKANYKSKGLICEEVYLYPSNRYFSPLYYKKMISPKIRELNINLFNYQIFQYVHCCLNSQIFISCNGSIYPCSMLREKTGDIFADELWELFHKGKLKKFWEIKKSDLDTCKECELNFKCFDCRALEYSKTKNLYGMHYCERVDQQISPPQDQV